MDMRFSVCIVAATAAFPILAQEAAWTKALKKGDQRDALHGSSHQVRGDSGKWSDAPRLVCDLSLQKVPNPRELDAWVESLSKKSEPSSTTGNTWLIFRSDQLDDNDRLWVERIERKGNQIRVVASLAKWRGKYFRNFTYYQLVAVNLGKLEAGKYQATWVLQPRTFTRFDGDGKTQGNWPKDDQPAEKKTTELKTSFEVRDGA